MRIAPKLLVIGTVVAAAPHRSLAIEAEDVLFFQKGPFSAKPQLGISEVYNSNIFYVSDDEVDDLISIISPGIKLQLGRVEHNYLSLDYTFDHLFYFDNPDLDASQHSIVLRDRFEWKKLSITGSDRIQFLSSPLGGVERIITSRNIERANFDDTYTLNYNFSEKTLAYLRGSFQRLDYQDEIPLYDVDTLTGTAGFGYRAFPKSVIFGELYYGQTTTHPNSTALRENPDVSFIGGYVGVRGSFTEKLSGSLKVGYEAREFSDNANAPSEPVVDISLVQKFSERTTLQLLYTRLNGVSSQYTRESYVADIVGLQLNQAFGSTGKWIAGAGANYYRYGYVLDGRSVGDYDYIRGTLSLGYRIQRWLSANLGYDFERLTGNQEGAVDYTVNRVTLRLAIGY